MLLFSAACTAVFWVALVCRSRKCDCAFCTLAACAILPGISCALAALAICHYLRKVKRWKLKYAGNG